MAEVGNTSDSHDVYHLTRFLNAQEGLYEQALAELRTGRKRTHWMWYIFPQIDGLGVSEMARRYSIRGIDEARSYLDHPVLGPRLRQCAQAVLAVEGRAVSEIFGYPDDMKLRSCMTLFARIAEPDSVFLRVLEKYFQGEQDGATLAILETPAE